MSIIRPVDILREIILGLMQGLTEFIPVSSSGHLVIGQHIFDGSSEHLFLEWINIGTLLALLVYFRRRIKGIVSDVVVNKNYRLARNIIITAVPAGAIGYFASDFIKTAGVFGSVVTVVIALSVVGVVMVLLERLPKASAVESGEKLSAARALFIGLLQVFALVPGVSRSGSTIIAGRLMGLAPKMAAEYSFLASIPIMCGLTLKLLTSSSDYQYMVDNFEALLLSNLVAFASGLFAIGFLIKYLSSNSLAVFGWYRIGLAAIVALVLLVQ